MEERGVRMKMSKRVRVTGVMNTVVRVGDWYFIDNTDIKAIAELLMLHSIMPGICVVCGTGATSISAIYSLLKLRCTPIVVTRKESEEKGWLFVREMRERFKWEDIYFGKSLECLVTEDEFSIKEVERVQVTILCVPAEANLTIPYPCDLIFNCSYGKSDIKAQITGLDMLVWQAWY